MTLSEIGQTLKKERKRQQLSLEDVYSTTKIGLDILMAIEEAELDKLPHFVYTRGFIRNYAEFLGLSGEEMVQAFDRAVEEDAEVPGHREVRFGEREIPREQGRKQPRSWRSAALTLILLLVLGWLVYFFFLSPPAKRAEKDTTPAVAENASQEERARKNATSVASNASDREVVAHEAAAVEDNAAKEPASVNKTGPGTPAEANATAGNRTAEAEQETSGNLTAEAGQGPADNRTSDTNATEELPRHELRIVASEACWLSVEVNDGVSDFYLQPGEERTIRFRGTGSFLLGNAGGVTLYLDGEKRPVEAESGEVREITLP